MNNDKPGECNSIFNPGKELFFSNDGIPIVRVCMAYGDSFVDFMIDGKFSIFDRSGCALMENIESDRKWRIKVKNGEKAKFQYGIILCSERTEDEANKCVGEFRTMGLDTFVERAGIR